MNALSLTLTTVCVLAAAGAVTALWRGPAAPPGGAARAGRRAYWWLAAAAACWGAGVVARQAWPGAAGGATAVPLTFADLPALLAPLAAAVGLAALARTRRSPGRPAADVPGWLADAYLLIAALFLIDWVIMLGPRYAATTAGAGTFALQLIRPLLDLLVLGAVLPLAVAVGRRALLPLLALLAVAGSDSLDVAARADGRPAGVAGLLLLTAAMCLLAASPAAATRWPGLPESARRLPRKLPGIRARSAAAMEPPAGAPDPAAAGSETAGPGPAGPTAAATEPAATEPAATEPAATEPAATEPAATELAATELAATEPGRAEAAETVSASAAALTAVAAGVAVAGWGLAGALVSPPVIAVAGGTAAAALAARMLGLARRQRVSALGRQEPGRRFRELADRTSDVVLICDLAGVIGYASPAVAGYGYPPESLAGRHLGDFLHPEDRIGGARVVRAAVAGPEQRAGHYPCRVRAADGTWRHVQATVSRQANPPGPDQLLITARDLSDQVALRRQVAHLTFHDGLTGLPNRAYIEDRARDALGAIGQRAATDPAAAPPGGGPGPEGTSPAGPSGGGPGETGPAGLGHGGAGVILLDLDGFTALNDSAGRSAGGLILTQAARRLRAVVPAPHTVARWGRDEFAVLIESGANASEIIDIAERAAASISAEPFRVGDRELAMHASVGVAVADGSPPGFLWRSADLAMLRARQAGGGRVEVPAAASRPDPTGRVELARDLQRAINAWAAGRSRPSGPAGAGGRPRPAAAAGTGEQLPPAAPAGAAAPEQVPRPAGPGALSLAFQPVMDVGAGRIVRADVLVQWHRAGQEVPTPELLSLAEASGLSVPLGEVVLREACAQAGEWHRAGLAVAACVPVPGAQAVAPRFAETVAEALAGGGLPASSLTLEVAERDLIGGGEVPPGLADARRAGARIAIAGFGTDYASLSYLRRQPVDAVKIAPSLVAGLGGDPALAKLVEAIVRVGRERGIDVIAAGVDQPAHLGWLRAMRCLLAQGSAIAPAMAVADLMAAVRAGPDGAGAPGGAGGFPGPPADPAGNGTPVPATPAGGFPDCSGCAEPPAPGGPAGEEAAVSVSDTETKLLPS